MACSEMSPASTPSTRIVQWARPPWAHSRRMLVIRATWPSSVHVSRGWGGLTRSMSARLRRFIAAITDASVICSGRMATRPSRRLLPLVAVCSSDMRAITEPYRADWPRRRRLPDQRDEPLALSRVRHPGGAQARGEGALLDEDSLNEAGQPQQRGDQTADPAAQRQ